jgi:hypothetical protein
MGLEDAVALGALLPKATPVSRVESRLVAYEKLRKERAEFVAKESFEQQHVPAKRGLYLRCTSLAYVVSQILIRSHSVTFPCSNGNARTDHGVRREGGGGAGPAPPNGAEITANRNQRLNTYTSITFL